MFLLRRVSHPSYRPVRVLTPIIILGLIWFVNYGNYHESSADFFKSLQHETLMSAQRENSSSFGMKSNNSVLPLEDNLQKPDSFTDGVAVGLPPKEVKKKEGNAVAQRLRARRQKVLEACKREKIQPCHINVVLTYRMFFFHRYDTSVCTVAKSASSTWREHLRRVNKGPPRNEPIDNDKLRQAFLQRPIEDIIKDVNSSSKIITVRHPLTRLVSAFRNKYRDGKPMSPHRPRAEVRIHKKLAGSYWHERFHQFWLPALFANNMVPPNTHLKVGMQAPVDPSVLKPYYDNCCPCHFDYEYITKVETLSEDLKYIFKKLSIPADPETSKNQERESVDYIYSYFEYYQNVPLALRREIYQYLKHDMDLFGYTLPKNFFV